jgi:hypothetical protein
VRLLGDTKSSLGHAERVGRHGHPRAQLDGQSNLCNGEGGAGTWSDGKLTTRIGKNSNSVRQVLEALVHFGAPEVPPRSATPHATPRRVS